MPNENPNPNPPTPPSNPPPAPPANDPPAGNHPPGEKSSPPPGSTNPPPEVKYELKAPEGSSLKPEDVQGIVEFAKANKLSPEAAQAIVERDHNAATAFRKAQEDAYEKQAAGWKETVLKDPEIGGTPEKVAESAALAHRFFQQFGSPELGKVFASTSLGNHPELVRLAVRVAKQLSNDQYLNPPKGGPQIRKTDAELFYGKKQTA